jgi:hypothetical protein
MRPIKCVSYTYYLGDPFVNDCNYLVPFYERRPVWPYEATDHPHARTTTFSDARADQHPRCANVFFDVSAFLDRLLPQSPRWFLRFFLICVRSPSCIAFRLQLGGNIFLNISVRMLTVKRRLILSLDCRFVISVFVLPLWHSYLADSFITDRRSSRHRTRRTL